MLFKFDKYKIWVIFKIIIFDIKIIMNKSSNNNPFFSAITMLFITLIVFLTFVKGIQFILTSLSLYLNRKYRFFYYFEHLERIYNKVNFPHYQNLFYFMYTICIF